MEIKNFNFNGVEFRAVIIDNDPWFVAKEVAEILGYKNTRKAVQDHCKSPKLLKGNSAERLTKSPRGIYVIPERDMYRLIMHSQLPGAKEFEEWVVGTVLPAIRKTGGYIQGEETAESEMELIMRGYQMLMNKVEEYRKKLEEDVTVDFYRAVYMREYLDKTDKSALGRKATEVCHGKKWEIKKERRVYKGNMVDVNLYPKKALDIAAKLLWGEREKPCMQQSLT